MKGKGILHFIMAYYLFSSIPAYSQEVSVSEKSADQVMDSLKAAGIIFNGKQKPPEIVLSVSQSVQFLQQRNQPQFWNRSDDPLRKAIEQLIFNASNQPYDSAKYFLWKFPFDSLGIPWDKFFIWEPMRVKISGSSQQQDIPEVEKKEPQDSSFASVMSDTLKTAPGNLPGGEITLIPSGDRKDTTIMVVVDTLHEVTSPYAGFPFRYFSYPFQSDSIKVAVNTLMKFLEARDSSVVYFAGIGSQVTPVWLNSQSDKAVRYWLKNDMNDSVTVWIGNPGRDTFGLYLEKEVTFKRPPKQNNYSGARIDIKAVDKSTLAEVQKVYIRPQYWKDRLEANFLLNQSALSNWVKGGENSLSLAMDITEYANYENKALNLTSSNFARIKLGFLKSGDNPIRKNLDLLETNTKVNHKAFGKFDFSAILLFKTQLAPGYNYNTDPPKKVSKFLNPAILTAGFGLDYKPNKTTSLNFSPLSYKGTYVTDTVRIDQTIYGIPKDKKALHEPGLSFLLTNEYKPVKSVSIVNRLQLFTNYIHNPQNIDIDWEMIATANINWFTDVRFNTHLIYDDDTQTQVMKHGQPVTNPDGTPRKTSRAQFKEMIGLSVVFRF